MHSQISQSSNRTSPSRKTSRTDKYCKEKEPPIISNTYTETIAGNIFNFSTTLSDLNCHQSHNNPSECDCNTSSHLYQPYGHVIAGDLSIIPNSKLRDLIAKGAKCKEPCKVDWDKHHFCVELLTHMHCNGLDGK